jgi:hypothetical protein
MAHGLADMATVVVTPRIDRRVTTRNAAVPLLQAFAVVLMVFPSDYVLKAVGADGYLAALLAYFLFLAWIAATLFGQHNPLGQRHPVRVALCALWLASLVSYALIDRGLLTSAELESADRWMMQLAGVSGVILVAAEFLRSMEDVRRVLRALTWGAAFCGLVAGLQFWLKTDITPYLHLPGFSLNQAAAGNVGIGDRGGVNRVPGTATDPIELGVTAGMLLPVAIYMAIYDKGRSAASRWTPVLFITVGIAASVSRSAILAVAVSMGVFVAALPPAKRMSAFATIPLAVAGVFMTAHGLIGTLTAYFLAGTSDSSVAHRVNNYPFVEQMVRKAPWFGIGGGAYIAPDTLHILDNQYLTTAIELGLVGLVALTFFMIWPALAALVARLRTTNPELRVLCAALAGGELAAALGSATFDSLSFPMFVNVQALLAGVIGAAWLLVRRTNDAEPGKGPPRYNNGSLAHGNGLAHTH